VTAEAGRDRRPIRVLYVMHTAVQGGAAYSLLSLIQHFPRGAVEAFALCPPGPAAEELRSVGVRVTLIPAVSMLVSVHGAPLRGWRLLSLVNTVGNLRYDRRVRYALARVRPDIVHLNESGMLSVARLASRAGYPVVMHARSVMDRSSRWVNLVRDRIIKRYVDRLIAIDRSVERSFGPGFDCQVLYNPMRDGGPGVPPEPRADTPLRVTYLSVLHPVKGVWDVVRCAKLLRDRPGIVFQVAGANPRPRSFYRSLAGRIARRLGVVLDLENDLAKWVKREGLEDRVVLLGHVEDTTALLQRTDILLFPSRTNGLGRSVFEAGRLGIPSVVTLKDPVSDIVEHGVTGLVLGIGDVVGLAGAVARLAEDHTLRGRLGAAARDKCSHQFHPPRLAAQMLGIYDSLLTKRASATLTHRDHGADSSPPEVVASRS
jgi:glycosyltransferase involved in cell wall biosynthesis